MTNVMGRIHSVESFGALDGPGIRYVLFLQGCPLRCLFCHNPDSWNTEGGQEIGSADVVRDVLRYKNFIRRGGVTLSGGEPLLQPDFAASILEGCRENGLPYRSGYLRRRVPAGLPAGGGRGGHASAGYEGRQRSVIPHPHRPGNGQHPGYPPAL